MFILKQHTFAQKIKRSSNQRKIKIFVSISEKENSDGLSDENKRKFFEYFFSNGFMGNQESQPLVTQYSFYLPETKGFFGQQWDRTINCSIAYHQRVMRFWSLFPCDKENTFCMKACGLYLLFTCTI